MIEQPDIDAIQLHTKVAKELPAESQIYFNGFTMGLSPMDCSIVLLRNNQPVAMLSTSHTIAKTMGAAMEGLIKDFEEKTGQHILKLDEVLELLQKAAS